MKKLFKYFVFALAVSLTACGTEDPIDNGGNNGGDGTENPDGGNNGDNGDNGEDEQSLVADFEAVVEEGSTRGKVTFTNKSKGAKTYQWDFGDNKDKNNAEENPVHYYDASGTYTVTLTAIAEDGATFEEKSKEVTVIVNKPELGIAIDGNFDDWNNIPEVKDVPLKGFTKVKAVATDNVMYVYMEGPKNSFTGANGVHVSLDLDNNKETGRHDGDVKLGFDTQFQYGYSFVWGMHNSNKWIGWDSYESPAIITEYRSNADGEATKKFEWKIDLEAARTLLTTNRIFDMPEYANDPQIAKDYSIDEIGVRIQYLKDTGNWTYAALGSAPDDAEGKPFSFPVKLSEYVEK